ncbi:MAG: hypothetical protein JW950_04070 [Deltaproteobacteria bacterium]|nr:hypothetical protein [Deltaproteobacteria bacterium]
MAKMILVGLVEPEDPGSQEAFEAWYLGNHVEDTTNCPGFLSGTVWRLERAFAGTAPAGYLTIYEVDAEDPKEAEKILGRYQRDPEAWPKRLPPNGSLKILGAGWYRLDRRFEK